MTIKIVKSVGRVFEVLELFKAKQQAMSIAEISKELNYPHSSTLSILKSMEQLGYLTNTQRFNFFPTHKLLSLGNWLAESVEDEEDILNFMNELYEQTGETINLSKRSGDYVKIIHGYLGSHAITINVREGTLMPASSSFVGHSALAILDDRTVGEILNALKEQNIVSSLSMSETKKLIESVRHEVIASGYDLFIKGIGAITLPVRSKSKNESYIIGLVGPTDRLKLEEPAHKELIKKLVRKHKIEVVGWDKVN